MTENEINDAICIQRKLTRYVKGGIIGLIAATVAVTISVYGQVYTIQKNTDEIETNRSEIEQVQKQQEDTRKLLIEIRTELRYMRQARQ